MRKLKYLALDFADKVVKTSNLSNDTFKEKVQAVMLLSFIEGFKEAFNFADKVLEEEKKLLEIYPTMSERRLAMAKMQERLKKVLEEMTDEEK